jgi:predicted RNA binding protein YcfA (HicA-like mRNA interferase family)
MAKVEKLITKMRNSPHGISFQEVAKVLEAHGYIETRVNGSHHQFRNERGDVITIKKSNPLKAVYVKDVLNRVGR